jgi:transcriptional regulator with XRE-family HTH domain
VTGADVKRLRESLGMTVPQFAQLLGVHLATAYRWEAVPVRELALDPLHASLMLHLHQTVEHRRRKAEQQAWGQRLVTGVLIGGTLAGLAVLLSELSEKPKPRRRRRR